jgi:hypothetical protein
MAREMIRIPIKLILFPSAIFVYGVYGIFLSITLALESAVCWFKRQLEA